MNCTCEVCKQREYNSSGIRIAEQEVIPFFKIDLLKLRHITHPFPMKYDGLLAFVFAYSKALAYDRAHSNSESIYYTDNKWMIRYTNELAEKFGMKVLHKSELKVVPTLVCEFNVEPQGN